MILVHLENGRTEKIVCVCIRACFKLRTYPLETFRMLEVAVREQTVGRTEASEWLCKFKSSVTSVEHSECSGRPSTGKTDEDVEQLKESVLRNRRNTTHSVADMCRILLGSVQSI